MHIRAAARYIIVAVLVAACQAPETGSTIIINATIVDGSGDPAVNGAVRIDGDRIVATGDLEPLPGESTIEAAGLVLAPGFIDTHSHHDRDWQNYRDMLAVVSQGVTTIVRGADGSAGVEDAFGYITQAEFNRQFNAGPAAANIASFSPHNSIRSTVMGRDFKRTATAQELADMSALVQADMDHGALGLGTGLEYQPGIFSDTEEVIALAKIASAAGGRYMSHVRDEDDVFMSSIDELIRIGKEADIPVHLSHIKLADKHFWGTTDAVIEKLNGALDEGVVISADIYPYVYWASILSVFFPEKDYTDMAVANFTFERSTAPETLILVHYAPNPEYAGLNFAEIAAAREQSPQQALLDLTQESDTWLREHGRSGNSIIARGMIEDDVIKFMRWGYTNICSDGGQSGGHPRGRGSFPRFLSRYAIPENGISLESAVVKMTSLSASNVGIAERGMIKAGYFADLVLFDPETIEDRATFADPDLVSTGVDRVWVNGILVFADGRTTGAFPGRIVHREGFEN